MPKLFRPTDKLKISAENTNGLSVSPSIVSVLEMKIIKEAPTVNNNNISIGTG